MWGSPCVTTVASLYIVCQGRRDEEGGSRRECDVCRKGGRGIDVERGGRRRRRRREVEKGKESMWWWSLMMIMMIAAIRNVMRGIIFPDYSLKLSNSFRHPCYCQCLAKIWFYYFITRVKTLKESKWRAERKDNELDEEKKRISVYILLDRLISFICDSIPSILSF